MKHYPIGSARRAKLLKEEQLAWSALERAVTAYTKIAQKKS